MSIPEIFIAIFSFIGLVAVLLGIKTLDSDEQLEKLGLNPSGASVMYFTAAVVFLGAAYSLIAVKILG